MAKPSAPHPVLSDSALQAICAHAQREVPHECCGIVFGPKAQPAADQAKACDNIQDRLHAEDPARFTRDARTAYNFDARDIFALQKSLRGDTPAKIVYHSHVDVGAYFSDTDQAAAQFDGEPAYPVEYVVVDVTAAGARAAKQFAWSDTEKKYVEIGDERGRFMTQPRGDSLFLRACRGEATPTAPLWMMRQAGRYLPEYREIRQGVSFLDLCKNPALAAEVTLQPIRRFGFDAAILFSDLLVPLEAMGLPVEFTEQGPTLPAPVRTPEDLARVHTFDPAAATSFVLETISRLRPALGATPLIGFAGAPFTVATYAVEGKTGKTFAETKKFFYRHPAAARQLLATIGEATRAYLEAQLDAGADAVQVFDSWVGVVSPDDWNEFVFPPTAALIEAVRAKGAPVIYFGNGATTILDRIGKLGADVYGIDWRLPLDEARARLATTATRSFAVQGNLDPSVLLAPPEVIAARTADVVKRGGGRGHVFNLGHGITPETPISGVEAMIRAVRGA